MAARNVYHDAVVRALQADGWTITDDPLHLPFADRELYVDLGAERSLLAAERGVEKIAIEIQSFLSPSPVHDLHGAVGQYLVYRELLGENDPERVLFMAVTKDVHQSLLTEKFGQFIVSRFRVRLLVFEDITERVIQWIS